MRLWPSSALLISQYTDRHPVHLLHFLIVSASLLSTLKNEILLCSACGYLIVCVSESLTLGYGERKGVSSETAMTLYCLAECSVPMTEGRWRGSSSPPVTVSVNTASKHTLLHEASRHIYSQSGI